MPPMYEHKCEGCEILMTVVRSFNDYLVPPSAEELEAGKKEAKCKEGKEHKWKKLVSSSVRALRGPGWRGGKGYW